MNFDPSLRRTFTSQAVKLTRLKKKYQDVKDAVISGRDYFIWVTWVCELINVFLLILYRIHMRLIPLKKEKVFEDQTWEFLSLVQVQKLFRQILDAFCGVRGSHAYPALYLIRLLNIQATVDLNSAFQCACNEMSLQISGPAVIKNWHDIRMEISASFPFHSFQHQKRTSGYSNHGVWMMVQEPWFD